MVTVNECYHNSSSTSQFQGPSKLYLAIGTYYLAWNRLGYYGRWSAVNKKNEMKTNSRASLQQCLLIGWVGLIMLVVRTKKGVSPICLESFSQLVCALIKACENAAPLINQANFTTASATYISEYMQTLVSLTHKGTCSELCYEAHSAIETNQNQSRTWYSSLGYQFLSSRLTHACIKSER